PGSSAETHPPAARRPAGSALPEEREDRGERGLGAGGEGGLLVGDEGRGVAREGLPPLDEAAEDPVAGGRRTRRAPPRSPRTRSRVAWPPLGPGRVAR